MKTKLSVTVEVKYDARKFTEEEARQALIGQRIRQAAVGEIEIVGLDELDTSDEHLTAIAEKRNLAMWWFDEEYVRNNLQPDQIPEDVSQIVKDLAGDSGVRERIAEEVFDYINDRP